MAFDPRAHRISDADDASLSNPAANDALVYDAASQKWKNQSLSGKVSGSGVTNIVALTQSAYDALATKDATTLYVITA
jgi:hypothetical protein